MESERLELEKSLVNEISKGFGQVKQLKVSCSDKEQETALESMLSSYEEALFILTGHGAPGITSSLNPPGSSPSVRKGGSGSAPKG